MIFKFYKSDIVKNVKLVIGIAIAVVVGGIGYVVYAVETGTWDFTTTSYTLYKGDGTQEAGTTDSANDDIYVDTANGLVKLKFGISDNNDDTIAEYNADYDAGDTVDTYTSTASGPDASLVLDIESGTSYYTSGNFTSRVLDGGASNTWQRMNSSGTGHTGLVGLWHMDNDWTDAKGSNDGTATGATFSTSSKLGSHAGSFAAGDEVLITDDPSFEGMSELTVELWFNRGNANVIILLEDGYQLFITPSSTLRFGINTNWENAPVSGVVSAGVWHHFVGTYDGSSIKVYVDNVLEDTSSQSGAVASGGSGLVFGQSADYKFAGLLDEVAIYNRALSAEEISAHYGGGDGVALDAVIGSSYFQVRSGATDTFSGDFVGPDDTTGTYYHGVNQTLSDGTSFDTAHRYVQYKAYLNSSSDQSETPIVDWMALVGSAGSQFDNTLGDFNLGTVSQATMSPTAGGRSFVGLSKMTNGGYNSYGTYTSQAFDAGSSLAWDSIAWSAETGLVSLWHMDNDWTDSKGSNDGTATGATFSTSAKLGSHAGSFSNGYINCGTTDDLGLITGEGTIEMWVNPADLTATDVFFGKIQPGGGGGYYLYFSGSSDIYFWSSSGGIDTFTNTGLIEDEWQHLAFTLESGTATLYRNGESVGSESVGTPGTSTANFQIGTRGDNGYPYSGLMDEVAIYDRALTADEIALHYNNGMGKGINPHGGAVKFQARSGSANPPTGDFLGSDGTSATFLETAAGTNFHANVADNQYFQYRAYLEEDNGNATPALNSVTVTYDTSSTYVDDTRAEFDLGTYSSTQWHADEVKLADLSNGGVAEIDASTSGLVGLWHMNESSWNGTTDEVVDASGSGNHGTAAGDATTTTSAKLGSHAGTFDGTGDYVVTPAISLENTFTVSTWINSDVASQQGWARIMCSGLSDFVLTLDPAGTGYKFIVNASSPYGTAEGGSVAQGQWQLITGVYDGTTGKLYVDGIEVGSDTFTAPGSSSLPVYISRHSGVSDYYFDGLIDEVAIYNRALSANEIADNAGAGYKMQGTNTFISQTIDAGSSVTWSTIDWGEVAGYGDALSAGSAGTEPSATTPGLVSLWRMNDNWNDSVGSNNGTAYGDATFTTGKFNSGGTFDGTGDYVDYGNDASLKITDRITLACWIKPDTITGDYNFIVSIYETSPYPLGLNIEGSRINLVLNNYGGIANSSTNLSTGVWQHVVVTYDKDAGGTDEVKYYLNGSPDGTANYSTAIGTNSDSMSIGRHNYDGGGGYFDGLIDEVAIYNRALSAGEIRQQYLDQVGNYGLVGLWHLDEASVNGTTGEVADTTSNNNGTAYGSTGTMAGNADAKFGTSFSFDGTGDYVEVSDHSSLRPVGAFAVVAWVKQSSAGGNQVPVGKVTAGSQGYMIYKTGTSNPYFFMYGLSPHNIQSGSSLVPGVWTHMAGVYDGSKLKIYMNGSVTSAAVTGTVTHSSNPLYFGKYGSEYFNGLIDEVAIYNRALSVEEITDHYRRGMMDLKMQVSTDGGTTWKGAGGVTDAYFTSNPGDLSDLASAQTIKYKATLSTTDYSLSPVLQGASLSSGSYATGKPCVVPNSGQTYVGYLADFTQTPGGDNAGSFKYQITNEDIAGGTQPWYYWNGSNWTSVGANLFGAVAYSTYSNTAADIATNMDQFYTDIGSGTFKFKAFFNSDGDQKTELSQVDLNYSAGQITLTAPDGGGSTIAGVSQNITWTTSGTVADDLILEYSTNGGSTYPNQIATGVAVADTPYAWETPNTVGTQYRVKIRSASDASVKDESNANFSVTAPTITLTAPASGNEWGVGTSQNITWDYVGNAGNSLTLDYYDGSSWTEVATGVGRGGVTEIDAGETGLVGLWHMNEGTGTTVDNAEGTAALDGTISGATWDTTNQKVGAACLSVSGTNSMTIQDDNSLDFGTGDFSIDMWMKYPSQAGGSYDYAIVLQKTVGGSPYTGMIVFPDYPASGQQHFRVNSSNSVSSVATNLNDDTWRHFAYVRTGTTLKMYINGILDNSNAISSINITNSIDLKLSGATQQFEGLIDEVAIYNVALDAATIQAHYSGGGNASGSGTYSWTVPDPLVTQVTDWSGCLVKITDPARTATTDPSDSFTIKAPTLPITAPNGTEEWEIGTTNNITWSYTATPETATTVKLTYYDGTSWNNVTGAASLSRTLGGSGDTDSGTGSYTWTVDDPDSTASSDFGASKVKIEYTARGVTIDESDADFTIKIPVVTVTAPNGGESWLVSAEQTITWTYTSGVSSTVNVEYSTNGGSGWQAVPSGTGISRGSGGTGSLAWTPTGVASATCQIQVTDAGRAGTSDTSDADFAISPGTITVTSPDGTEGWYVFELKNITWTSTGSVSDNLTIQYSSDNGSSWDGVATGQADDGTYENWLIPDDVSSTCLVKIFDADETATVDQSDATFSILEPTITVSAPNGAEDFIMTNQHNITWSTSAGVSDSLNIYYSTNSGSTYPNTVAVGETNDGTYAWSVPYLGTSTVSTIKVKIEDANRTATIDTSDEDFNIIPTPTVTITSPNGGEAWYVNTSHPITWNSTGAVSDNLEMRYSTDNGSTWPAGKILATGEANDGTYTWNPLPDDLSTNCKVKITDLDAPVVTDPSNNPFVIQSPTITVTAPNGGENWTALSSKTIAWNSSAGVNDNLTIEYSTNSGSTWTGIATGEANDGTYTWDPLPDIEYSTCRIQITDASRTDTNDMSNNDFTIAEPYITITSPDGAEGWKVGTEHDIIWDYSDMVSDNLTIRYSTNNGSSWTGVATGEACDGTYTWSSIPDAMSAICLIKIFDADRVATDDESDDVWEIATPTITITAPNDGESWIAGTAHNITWTSEGTVSDNLTIQYSTNGGSTWTGESTSQADDGTYSWTVDDDVSTTAQMRIFDASRATATDDSDANFTIASPTITVTAPDGAESWIVGTVHEITWSASDGVSNLLTIQYSINGGSTWTNEATNQANDGSYMWSVDDAESSQAQIKIFDQNRTATSDESDIDFTIATPSITIIGPNGAESWIVGTEHAVTWSTTGTVAHNLTIQYSDDNGSSWTGVSTGEINDGTYPWAVSDAEGSQTLLKIFDASRPAASDTSDEVFTIATPIMEVIDPNGDEEWVRQKSENITWTTTGSFSNNLTIRYSTNSGSTWNDFSPAATGEINDGTYTWDIALAQTTGTNYRIKVFDGDRTAASDTSDADFTILPEPTITITSPDGGEQWIMGTAHNITWGASGGVSENLIIKYSANNGTTWTTEATGEANDGTYPWTVPDTEGTQYLVRAYDGNDSNVTDDSDATFSVVSSTITISSPTSGDTWYASDTHDITWTSVGTVNDNLTIRYSTDDGLSYTDISTGQADDGAYNWTLPDITSSTTCHVKIFDASHTDTVDTDGPFTIGAKFSITAPNGAERWFALNTHDITWTTDAGAADNVKLEYSMDSGSTYTTIISSTDNDGIYPWTLPNTHMTNATALVRVSDVLISSANDVSDAGFKIDYYDITWNVKMLLTPATHLDQLSVTDTNGWSDVELTSPIVHSYPYGTYSTTWNRVDYFDKTWRDWTADSDEAIEVQMTESTIAPEYRVLSNFAYDSVSDPEYFLINSWVERGGLILTEPASCTVAIYDTLGSLLTTVVSVSATAEGIFWQTWEQQVAPNSIYFAKVTINYGGIDYSSGLSYSVNVSTLGGVDDTVENIYNSVGDSLASTIGTINANVNDIATSVGTDLTGKVTDIDTDIASLSAQVAGYETTQAAFRTATTSTIGAILEDTETTLPDYISSEGVASALAKGVQAEILTRPTTVKTGAMPTIRFRTTTGLYPTITVYDADNNARVSDATMTEIGTTGIYEYDLTVLNSWGTGDFTVICNESTKQSVDSMILTVSLTDLETVQTDITSIISTLSTIDTNIDTIDTDMDSLMATVDTISTNTASISVNLDPVLTRLGTSSDTSSSDTIFGKIAAARGDITIAQEAIVDYIGTVETVLGTSADDADDDTVFGEIAGVVSDVDSIGSDATNASTYALSAKTQATTAASTAAEIKTLVSAGKSTETYAAIQKLQSDLMTLQSAISKVPESVSTESLTASIKDAMAKLGDVAVKEGYKELVPDMKEMQPGSAASSDDMQQIRNSIVELRALMDQIRSLMDRKVNVPVVKTWMEGK